MSMKNYIIMLSIVYISTNSYCTENNIKQNEIINNNSSCSITINNDSAPKP